MLIFCQNQDSHSLSLFFFCLSLCICSKQHSLWVQGDMYRSKQRQQQLRQNRQQERDMARLISSMDDVSINTSVFKSQSMDEVRLRCGTGDRTHTSTVQCSLPLSVFQCCAAGTTWLRCASASNPSNLQHHVIGRHAC